MRSFLLSITTFICCATHAQDLAFRSMELSDDQEGSRGVSLADLDGDGLLDIAVANQVDSARLSGNTLYFNEGGSYRKTVVAAGDISAWSESVHTVDIDNDRDLDLFFTTRFGAPNLLFLNDGMGEFTPVNARELTGDITNSPGACWCDYDLDGDLDVFVVNRDGQDDQLYINDGSGGFSRSADGPWIGNKGDGRSCAWGDLNSDGRPDVFVVNFVQKKDGHVTAKHRNYLYYNLEDGTFVEERDGIHVKELNASYGVSLVDYDYDKDLDIYVTNVSVADENSFYTNLGKGNFKKVTNSEISYEIHRPSKGQTWGDFNNDGWLDFYVANGTEGYPEIQNFLFTGNSDQSFNRIYTSLPAIEGHISAGTASGDMDRDGDLDLYVCNWGGDAEANDFYINENPGNSWVVFQLQGTQSNSYGIGSWITIWLDDGSILTRYFSRETGYGSENAPEIHFGIPAMAKIDSVAIDWPSGIKQQGNHVEVNHVYQVLEDNEFKRDK